MRGIIAALLGVVVMATAHVVALETEAKVESVVKEVESVKVGTAWRGYFFFGVGRKCQRRGPGPWGHGASGWGQWGIGG